MDFIQNSFNDSHTVLQKFIADSENMQKMERAIQMLVTTFNKGGKVLSCGNGGSMCDAMHFAEELTGRFRKNRPALKAVAISDSSHITCVANDFGFEFIFSRYVEGWGEANDTLLAISTSGNSPNVLNAVNEAKKKGMKVIGLLGKGGGTLKNLVDVALIVDSQISDRIQEVHIKCIHIMIEGVERSLFPANY